MLEDVTEAVPIASPEMLSCTAASGEDLALITIDPEEEVGHSEFFDIASDWIHPTAGKFSDFMSWLSSTPPKLCRRNKS